MLVQEQDYLQHDTFIEHYGVPGMKWGVRKSKGTTSAYNQMLRAKQAKKAAGKASRKAYSDAYNYSSRHIISQYFGKHKKMSDSKWAASTKAMQKSNKADDAYKKAKKAYKNSKKKDIKNAVRDYDKAWNEAGKAKDRLMAATAKRKEAYKKTGKTAITRIINVARGKGDAVKALNKVSREEARLRDASYKADEKMQKAYKRTGRNRLSAIRNNMKYGR